MSELTSLKVPRQVRDRLAIAAKARGLTVRALLDELSRQAVDAALMDQAAERMAHLRETDPDGWADYFDEGRAWEEGTVERLDA
jgi:regulator of RNase E activity RraB